MKDTSRQAQQMIKSSRSRRRWQRFTAGISGLVILGTLASLALPAAAMEGTFFCDQQEHTHEESCYQQKLTCTIAEGEVHTHTDACYGPEEETLTCEQHVHTEACYRTEQAVSCQPHTHGDGCYATEQVLTCQDGTHHDHTDACCQDGGVVCGYQAHGDGCYESQKTLTCTQQEHVCTDACAQSGETRVLVCQEPDHVHDASCYTRQRPLLCTQSTEQPHVHTESCYEQALTCTQQEHTHTLACQSDPQADIELPEQWERKLPQELTGNWPEDVVAVAESQMRYTQSEKNFVVAEDGVTQHFYSRYGAWYGQPYAPWNTLFAAFCLHYAGVKDMPTDPDAAVWVRKLSGEMEGFEEWDLYRPADAGTAQPGELAFLDSDADAQADAVAIVTGFFPGAETTPTMLETIWGTTEVKRKTYNLEVPEAEDPVILGYAALPPQPEEAPEVPQEPEQPQELTQTAQGAQFDVTVTYTQEAALPEGAQLQASEYAKDSPVYKARYDEAAQRYEWTEDHTDDFRLFSIGFYLGQEEVEPAAPVMVRISYPGQEAQEHQVTHYAPLEQEAEVVQNAQTEKTHSLDATSTFADGTQTVEFEVGSFSDFGVLTLTKQSDPLTQRPFVLFNWETKTMMGNEIPRVLPTGHPGEVGEGYLTYQELPDADSTFSDSPDSPFVKLRVNTTQQVQVFAAAAKWEFEQANTPDQYYMKTQRDGETYYLELKDQTPDGLYLHKAVNGSVPEKATPLLVTQGEGDYENQVCIARPDSQMCINRLGSIWGNEQKRPYGTYSGRDYPDSDYFYLVTEAVVESTLNPMTQQPFVLFNWETKTLMENTIPTVPPTGANHAHEYGEGYLSYQLLSGVDSVFSEAANSRFVKFRVNTEEEAQKFETATKWEFAATDTLDQYYMKTQRDGETYYLELKDQAPNGLYLHKAVNGSVPEKATPLLVTQGEGDYENQVWITRTDSKMCINRMGGIWGNGEGRPYGTYAKHDFPETDYFYLVTEAVVKANPKPVEGMTPKGTTIHMFDYWLTGEHNPDDAAHELPIKDENGPVTHTVELGINKDHSLKFNNLHEQFPKTSINYMPEDGSQVSLITRDIVQNTLVDGYPVLTPGKHSYGDKYVPEGESLNYLFDPGIEVDGKRAYPNVTGLLQNKNGYYVYDSQVNFAEMQPGGSRIQLWDQPGIMASDPNRTDPGQFFPFNQFADVHYLKANNEKINHYMGLTLTSRFVQKYGGHTNSRRDTDVIFEFAGDDDVWIFIDDVLVADLGGIRASYQVSVDFATGAVSIKNADGRYPVNTTIKAQFEKAGKENEVEWREGSNTFADDTYHTLKFFYMERGNWDSNLRLKYNLTTYPPTGIIKINQNGARVAGAHFSVYSADDQYNKLSETPVFGGYTDDGGELIFTKNDGTPMHPGEVKALFGQYGKAVLVEDEVPKGHRKVGSEIHLRFVGKNLVCENTIQSGAYTIPNLQLSAPADALDVQGERIEIRPDQGTLFAVVLKYVGDTSNGRPTQSDLQKQANWKPIVGDYQSGFALVGENQQLSGSEFIKAAIEAAKSYGNANVFTLSASGAMQVQMDNLPGDIATYYHVTTDAPSEVRYTVAYYYTKAGTLGGANAENTVRLQGDYSDENHRFEMAFGTDISVPNLVNRIAVQKFDETGNILPGASFAMYEVEEREENGKHVILYKTEDGKRIALQEYTIDPDTGVITAKGEDGGKHTIRPAKNAEGKALVCTTAETPQPPFIDPGTAALSYMTSGQYILREIKAPAGYKLNDAEIMVLITDFAAYANAGVAQDGVSVARAPGNLASNLREFASYGVVDNTLHWICAQMRISGVSTCFADVNNEHYVKTGRYVKNNVAVDFGDDTVPNTADHMNKRLSNFYVYEGNPAAGTFNYKMDQASKLPDFNATNDRLETDIGWAYLEIYQNYEHGINHVRDGAVYQKWDHDISQLFSRSLYIKVTDQPEDCTLEIEKQVEKQPAGENPTFDFQVKLTDADGKDLPDTYTYTIQTKQDGGTWAAGEEQQLASGDTIQLSHNQKAVITGIPKGSEYTVTEKANAYAPEAEEKVWKENGQGTNTYTGQPQQDLSVSGQMYWHGTADALDTVSYVKFTNTHLPTLTLEKVSSDTQNPLAGAEFTLYRKTAGEGTTTVKEYFNGTIWVPQGADKPPVLTSDADGKISLRSIPDGTYYLEENKAPDGYVRFHGTAVITVNDGKITKVDMATESTIKPQFEISTNGLTLTIPNQTGTVLPQTGGHGTWPMTVLGALLTLTAAAFLLRRRKTA